MYISDFVRYIGVNDRKIDLFEGLYSVPHGMAYNSYVVLDEKVAVLDTVDAAFWVEWLENLRRELGDRKPDYLVVHHMEPDHSANIANFASVYPEAKIVASQQAFRMMKNFFGKDFADRRIVVKDGSTLSLGSRNLHFVAAPMVHWPEVMMSFDDRENILFSADAFGKFGALDAPEEWTCEARRYYFGIVGKFGAQVQAVLKKAKELPIHMICPLHGPVLKEEVSRCIELYDTWSSYRPEEEGVLIAYTSVYGNTKKAVAYLAEKLKKYGCKKVAVSDLARDDMAETVEDAFRYSKMVLATTTYNGDVFPFMKTFLRHLTERNYSNRTVAFVENGSWAPQAAKVMKEVLLNSAGINFAENSVRIFSAVSEENKNELDLLAKELCENNKNDTKEKKTMAKYVCGICGWTYDEEEGAPDHGIAPGTKWEEVPEDFVCPLCSVGKENFDKEA